MQLGDGITVINPRKIIVLPNKYQIMHCLAHVSMVLGTEVFFDFTPSTLEHKMAVDMLLCVLFFMFFLFYVGSLVDRAYALSSVFTRVSFEDPST